MSRTLVHRVLGALFPILTLLLLTRALIIEPFQVTTGSMAPVLLGVHRQCRCPTCGRIVVVGAPSDDSPMDHYDVKCPCGQTNLDLDHQPDELGQRIFVDKLAFEWRTPRRWEVVVFRGPDERAAPYVKRVVGLPGESVQIKNGDVYINSQLSPKPTGVCRAIQILLRVSRCTNDDPKEGWTDYWIYNGSKVNLIEVVPLHLIHESNGTISRSLYYQSAGRHGIQTPYRLGSDEYFVLGDNSAVSDDSRFWPIPGVKASALIGPVIFPRLESGE